MKRVLFECKCVWGVQNAWEQFGYECLESPIELSKQSVKKICDIIEYYMNEEDTLCVFSFDFSPAIAMACQKHKIVYISWVLDCPHVSLWSKSAEYEGNRIFVFDYVQYRMVLERGLEHVYYLPLCADLDSFEQCIARDQEKQKERYYADVSFVGNLYNDEKHNLFDKISYLPDDVNGYLDALMDIQRKMWGVDLLYDAINGSINSKLKEYVQIGESEDFVEGTFEVMFANILGQKLAQLERMEVCSYLAQNYDFHLYTGSDTSYDPAVRNCGHADYLKEMPLIFNYSKINLHITLRSITSGMSLRVLDVLACGGFLLTNYQPEIAEYFIDGEELVMYHSFEDMYEKIDYYLEHEDERKQIARAGYKKVKECFNYIKGFGQIVEILEGING